MRIFGLSFFILISTSAAGGGFKWPNVQYESAKLYLLNIELEKPSSFDWHIYEDGVYATSKIGSGFDLEESFLNKLHGIMARGVNELRMGLGKCYMPRHGIIYYDKNGKPVAAFTACFECDKISLWSNKELPRIDYENVHNNWEKAEKQIEKIKSLFKSYDYPVYNNDKEYRTYHSENKDFEDRGEMFLTDDNLDSKFESSYTQKQVKEWLKASKRSIKLTASHEENISAGGVKYQFRTLVTNKGNTNFIFDSADEDARLVEAYITHGSIILPNGVSIGMSVEDVQSSFMVYDGIAWPEHIQVKGKKITIDYYFDNRTLTIIKATFLI